MTIIAPTEERYETLVDSRHPRAALHYRVPLPRGFEPRPIAPPPIDDPLVIPLALLGPPDDLETGVRVVSFLLPKEMRAADWLESFLRKRRVTPLDVATLADGRPRVWYRDGEVIGCATALKQVGPPEARITLVDARSPESRYLGWYADFEVAIAELAHLRPTAFPYAENLRLFSGAAPGDYATYLPQSWQPVDALRQDGPRGMRVTHFENAHARGQARITFIVSGAAQQADDVLQPYLRSVSKPEVELTLHGPAEVPPYGGLEHVLRAVGTLRVKDLPPAVLENGDVLPPTMQLRVDVGRLGEVAYLFALVAPTRELDFDVAAVAERAYEILGQELRCVRV